MSEQERVLVIGGAAGIGLALVEHYTQRGSFVISTTRSVKNVTNAVFYFDSADSQAATMLQQEHHVDIGMLDMAFYTIGVGTDEQTQTEASGGSLNELEAESIDAVWRINALAAFRCFQAFSASIRPGGRFIFLSSQRGSLSEVESGGSFAYAVSKAGLNMMVRKFAHLKPEITVVAMHPGWVRTRLGGDRAPLTPEQAVIGLTETVDRLRPADSGAFLGPDGSPLPW